MSNYQYFLLLCAGLIFPVFLSASSSPKMPIHSSTLKNRAITFHLNQQEVVQGIIQTLNLIDSPNFGKTLVNEDHSITYIPEVDTCAETDQFNYQITDENGTYILTFLIEIRCEALTILNGFSTKEERDPHTFTILGVEDFPENTLHIFNSDGNEIFYQKGYHNNWNGTINEEAIPNDYTYYYVFNDGEGNTYSGYLRLD